MNIKNTALILLFNLILYSNLFSQNIEFEDVVFKGKLISLGVDLDNDNEISISEAELITKLIFPTPYLENLIADISGIEFFINLDTLSCEYQDIRNIKLNTNKKLRFVDFSGNERLDTLLIDSLIDLQYLDISSTGYEIDSVNLSNFPELKKLYIDNKSTLDVSKNYKLEILVATHIADIDVRNNAKLKRLACNNQTHLDLKNNTELEYLNCLAYGYSDDAPRLNELDLSNNTKLKELICLQNNLSELDLSNNIELKILDIQNISFEKIDLSNNLKLEELNCGGCNLDSLDLSFNVELVNLSCFANNLKSLSLNNNPNLEYLNCENNQLDSLNVLACSKLTTLYCAFNNLVNLDLSNNSLLEKIQIVDNPNLTKVCVWVLPFPPDNVWLNDWGCPNLEYINCYVGVNEIQNTTIKIFPNPFHNYLNVSLDNSLPIEKIKIYNNLGIIVFDKNYYSITNSVLINVSDLPAGNYFIQVKTANSTIAKELVRIN